MKPLKLAWQLDEIFVIIEVFVQHVRETGYKCVSEYSRVLGHCTSKTIYLMI